MSAQQVLDAALAPFAAMWTAEEARADRARLRGMGKIEG